MTVRVATYNLLHGMTVIGGVPQPSRDDADGIVGPPVVDRQARCATPSPCSMST